MITAWDIQAFRQTQPHLMTQHSTLHSAIMKSEPVCGQEAILKENSNMMSLQIYSFKNDQFFFPMVTIILEKMCVASSCVSKPSLKKPNILKLYLSLDHYQTIPKCRRSVLVSKTFAKCYEIPKYFVQRRGCAKWFSLLPPEVCNDRACRYERKTWEECTVCLPLPPWKFGQAADSDGILPIGILPLRRKYSIH